MNGSSSSGSFCGSNSEFLNITKLLNNWYPELTDCFQQTALTFIPCGWLWLTSLILLAYLRHYRQFVKLPATWRSSSRLICGLTLVLISGLLMLASFEEENGEGTDGSFPISFYLSHATWAVTFLLASILMLISQRSGLASPCVIFIFWTFAVVVHIVPVYTLALQDYKDRLLTFILVCLQFSLLCIEFIMQCLGDGKYILTEPSTTGKPCPAVTASFVSRVSYSWAFQLVYQGYKRAVVKEDVFDLPYNMQCRFIVPDFLVAWRKEQRSKGSAKRYELAKASSGNLYANLKLSNGTVKGEEESLMNEKTPLLKATELPEADVTFKQRKPSLYKVLSKLYYLELFKCQLVGLFSDLLLFVNPLLLQAMISYVESKEDHPKWYGYTLAGSFFVVAIISSLMTNFRFYSSWLIGTRIKAVLTAAVYKKSLTMNAAARRKFTIGTLVNLMAVDCPRFQDLTTQLYVIVSWPIQMALALYMLYTILGYAFIAGLVVLIGLIPANAKISTLVRRSQTEQLRLKDMRIKLMNEILSGIKVLKLYAWEPSFEAKIAEIRQLEIVQLKKGAVYQSLNTLCWLLSPVLVTVSTFIAYVLITGKSLTPSTAFVSMSLFNIIKNPMNTLPQLISSFVQCQVSMVRLRDYLASDDLEDKDTVTATEEFPLTMENGSYMWDIAVGPVLKNITLRVPKQKLIAVVGPVGAGKSSLLSAFLGEMERLQGKEGLKGSIAYVPQQAWIQNLTLRANILFEKPMEESRYRQTLRACALEPDLKLLPGGEFTEIGEKGINLSGGQKQRISLARAVYQNADVYLMDDPLSAVDAHVGKHIFENVIGSNGMIKDKTRILVTHGVHWLPFVDSIIVLDQGQVKESGTFQELMSHDGPFAEFVRTYMAEHEDEDIDDPEVQLWKDLVMEQVEAITSEDDHPHLKLRKSISHHSESFKSDSSIQLSKKISLQHAQSTTTQLHQRLIQEEKSEKGKIKTAVFIALLQAFGYIPALFLIMLLLGYNGCNVASGIWLSEWTSDSFLNDENNTDSSGYTSRTYMYLGVYSGLCILQIVANGGFILLVLVQFVSASQTLHNRMLSNILHQSMAFFDTTPLGRVLNRFSRDVDVVDSNLSRQLRLVLNNAFTLLSVVVTITYTTPYFLIAVLPIGIIYFIAQKFYIPSSRQFRRLESVSRSPIFSHFAETLSGTSSLRAYGVCDRFCKDSQNMVDTNVLWFYALSSASRWLRIRLEILGNCIVMFAAFYAVISDDISSSLVGLSISYALQVTSTLNMLIQNITMLETNVVSVERIVEYSGLPQEPKWIDNTNRPQHDWPDCGQIEFDHFSTRYRPMLELVLKNISFKIKAGEKVGVVGRTGAGKSSLSMALFRMIEGAEGKILIDGLDISTIGLHDLRAKLTILPQDPVLFSGTIRFNLDPFDLKTDDEVWDALKMAHIGLFVSTLPGGLQYYCEEGGQNLSVGQRQLVCLARSLLRKTKILVLDEATAAVDLETDALLQATIREAFRDYTVLTVAHRIKTVLDYDRIMVLSNGEIVENDSPENLLKNENGVFYSMANESSLL